MTSETDALANMMAADSRRVDQMVDDLGVVKGRVESVHKGVDELRSALAVLVRHEVLMEASNKAVMSISTRVDVIDTRVGPRIGHEHQPAVQPHAHTISHLGAGPPS